ncbi:TetR/AcrR family transcriptional regulator [Methylorubrum salsuginis]|uniref:Transcriptional regulator, TetR family n=1 Tax=Methylorubrum salsuginis TaxID=414703 RepID=A0A1I4KN92_9HYPH|nr:TetR/AcrR family transcriptional regulator [Methylorubrum salsuginis]SFL80250.1 transcriptional regulator, TetR family [Methylorubrum salsuginis]
MSSETLLTSARRPGRPARGTEGEATQRILDAAMPIFLAEGFEAASIDSIVAAAGISKKTFYVRFNSKADLFEAVFLRFIDECIPTIEREAGHVGSASDCLNRIAVASLKVALTPNVIAFQRIITAEAMRFPQFALTMNDFGQSRLHSLIERCLEQAVEAGEITVPDIRFAADCFLNLAIRPPVDRAVLGLERAELTHVKRVAVKRAVEFFLGGCRP